MRAHTMCVIITAISAAFSLASCAPLTPTACTGSFDAEITPTAEGFASKTDAAEAWASTSHAPDTGWVETADGAINGNWVLTIVEPTDGGWLVEAQRCASALEQ